MALNNSQRQFGRVVAGLRLMLVAALLLACAAFGLAQVPTGAITGVVKDVQGLAVTDAVVTLTNQNTNTTFTSKTTSTGGYQFENIDYGMYRISVAKDGFKTGVVANIMLDASTVYSVAPVTLEVGATNQTLVVEAGAELVQTTSAELSETVEKKQIEDLPIINRTPMSLVGLEAGVNQNGRSVTVINGQRESFANVTLDGINIQDNFIRTNTLDFTPNLPFNSEAEEFTVKTTNTQVQDGGASSQVSIVTPRGTNAWHGQAFWYYRTAAWAANDWFNDAFGIGKPALLQNQGGGNLGGPIKKDKLFIYGYYELLRLRSSTPLGTPATILSSSARQGLFTYTPVGGTTPVTVNLLTLESQNAQRTTPSPVFTIDPRIAALLNRVPTTANSLGAGDGINTLAFNRNARSNETQDNFGFRGDYNINAHNSLSATFKWNRQVVDRPDIDTSFDVVPLVQNNDAVKFLSTQWRWNPNSNLTNEVRFGFDLAPAFFLTSQKFGADIIAGTAFTNPDPNFLPQGRNTHTWSYQDNATWVRGNHTIAFGAQLQRVTIFSTNAGGDLPTLNLGFSQASGFAFKSSDFPQPISALNRNLAQSILATLSGFVTTESQLLNATSQTSGYVAGAAQNRNFIQNDLGLYVGDTWRINRKLTATLGVRWEYFNPVNERNGLILLPVVPAGQTVEQTLLGDATVDFAGGPSKRGLYHPDRNNFGPNIGIAWDPRGNGKMAIRAGYSINYVNDSFITAAANAASGNAGLSTTVNPTNLVATVSSPFALTPPPFAIPTSFQTNFNNLGVAPNAGFAIDPNIRTPYVQQWNLSVQRDLGWNTTLQVSYVGNHAVALFRGIDLNQVIINSNGFLADFNRARANLFLTGNPACASAGCQPLTFFPNLMGGGFLSAGIVQQDLQEGIIGDLADLYRTNGIVNNDGTDPFAPNPFLRGADLLKNGSSSNWNAGIVELRRRFGNGLYFQANYTFSKALTDYSGDTNGDQTRFLPLLDNAQPNLERSRANFDITHAFKANFTYEFPIGAGHRLAPSNRIVSMLVGGWNTGSIFTWQTGSPYSILSAEGLLNRVSRSSRETAFTTETLAQLKSQAGAHVQADGTVFVVNPALVNPDGTGAADPGLTCAPTITGGFCNPQPGQDGNIPLNFFSGPTYFDWDLAMFKRFKINERIALDFRGEASNVLNHPVFFVGDQNINSQSFGQSTSTVSSPRVIQLSLKLSF
jgi:Carboxypeptidase regulatory-like domain